jgi:hypothetical protein
MRGEAEFAEEGIHEATPFIIVRLGEGEDDRNVRFDIDSLKNGDRRRRNGVGERNPVIGGVGRCDTRDIGIKERIGIGNHDGRERAARKMMGAIVGGGARRDGEGGAAIARKRFRREPAN